MWLPAPPPTPPTRPNIIFIIADDLGPDAVGCYGSQDFAGHTPRLDSLAASGFRFTRAYCTGICSPTRAQYATGQYPFRNGVLDIDGSRDWLNTDKPNLNQLLKEAGYTRRGAGKSAGSAWAYLGAPNFMDEYLEGETGGYWNIASWSLAGPSTVNPGNYAYFPDALQAFGWILSTGNYPQGANSYKPFYFYYALINPHVPILRYS